MPTPHLPNEIWLSILTHCTNDRETWLCLRPVNHQIRRCVEHHFADNILPNLQAILPMIMPSYDARNPIKGQATFRYNDDVLNRVRGTDDYAVFDLGETGPQFFLAHFLGRWAGLKDVDGGMMRESVLWEVRLGDRVVNSRMKNVCALGEGVGDEEARISFEWKPTLTSFFRS